MGGGINQGDNSARGTLTVSARVSNGASRYAMPSPSVSEFDYAALLYPNGGSSDKFVQGTKAADSDNLIFSFQRPDKTENISFTLEVFAFKAGTAAADFSAGNAVLSGKTKNDLTVNDGSETIDVNETIALLVNEDSEEPGTVSLKIAVPEGCSLAISDAANFDCKESAGASGTYIVTQKDASGLPAKAYPIKFTVMDGEKIVQVFTEYINVLHGMRTDTWSGMEKGAAKEIQITNSASTTFFVRGTGEDGWYAENGYESVTGDNDNSGEFLRPFATIQKALDTVLAMNDGTSTYTIYVDGTLTATSSAALADFDALSQPLTVKILGLSESSKAVLDGNGTARGIVVGSGSASSARKDVNLTLENLTVQNAAGNGITLYCQSANAHTIKNCEIKNSNGGHGIYQYYGSLDLQDCEISGNKATSNGGGVYSYYGLLTMTDCTVSGNEARGKGAGIYFYSNTGDKLTIKKEKKDCIISENIATGSGGGVYVCYSGNATIEGCTISDNTTTGDGGGVYFSPYWNSSPNPVMKDCTVSGNEASNGKGACLSTTSYNPKLMLDGTTKFVQADDIYLSNGTGGLSTVGVMSTLETAAPVATITPSAYTTIRQVLSAGTGVTIDENVCKLFNVTPQKSETDESVTEWEIAPKDGDSTAGVLKAK